MNSSTNPLLNSSNAKPRVSVSALLDAERRTPIERSLTLRRVFREPASEQRPGAERVVLDTDRGRITTEFHPPAGETKEVDRLGVIWVGGAGGGLDGPAAGLYPAACAESQSRDIAGMRLDYRFPNNLVECVLDVLLGVAALRDEGVDRVALVGHSFGGAVVISAAALSPHVHAVVAMSTQTYGTDLVSDLAPRPLLLVHGEADEILPARCSELVYQVADEPKTLQLYPGARHGLDSVRGEVLQLLLEWIPRALTPARAQRTPRRRASRATEAVIE